MRVEIHRTRARKRGTSPINYTGSLANSLQPFLKKSSKGFSLDIEGLEYGKYVDEGGNKGARPPIENIVEWIKQKPVRLTDLRGGRLSESSIRGIAYAISKSIGLNGIHPTNFIDDTIEKAMLELDGILNPIADDVWLNIEDILLKAGYIKKGENYIIEKDGTN